MIKVKQHAKEEEKMDSVLVILEQLLGCPKRYLHNSTRYKLFPEYSTTHGRISNITICTEFLMVQAAFQLHRSGNVSHSQNQSFLY